MADAMLAAVSGMKAHQGMIEVAGNNLANVNTSAFKASRVRFCDLLSETLKEGSQPSGTIGGMNPQQLGNGARLASVDRDMSQGSLMTTGQPLDMAIEGDGYFVLNDGNTDVFTRVGAMAVDSKFYLVDPATGYRVQRFGSEGLEDGFQEPSDSAIRIPYDQALPAKPTDRITFTGNLSADDTDPTTNRLRANMAYTTASGAGASRDTLLTDIVEGGDTLVDGDVILLNGVRRDGSAVTDVEFDTFTGGVSNTLGDLLDFMNTTYADPADPTDLWSVASISNGEVFLTDVESGYSQTDLELSMKATAVGALEFPKYFRLDEAGGQAARQANIEIYDSQGMAHSLSASLVKTTTVNKWDLVLLSVTGDVDVTRRRVPGINFLADGSYGELDDPTSGYFGFRFAHDPLTTVNVTTKLGTLGELDGLSQMGGASTAVASDQDGYSAGWLTSISVSLDGVLMGLFSNGARKPIAALKMATFQNPAALLALGENYYEPSSNSGEAVLVRALTGGAGSVHGGALEKSNVDVANEFISLIQAQNGFQANARTIKVSDEMLSELTNLIR
jgi:flagellar hook protein FlgE